MTAKELRRIAQVEKEDAAALAKVQKQTAKQTERDARIAKKVHEQQIVLDQAADSDADDVDAAEVNAVEKRRAPARRDVVNEIVTGKKKSSETPMAHGAPVDKEIESRILKKVNHQLESALQATMDASAEVLKELRLVRSNYSELKENNEQLQSAVLSLRNDMTAKRPISEVTQSEAVFKRVAREDFVTNRREAIETNRSDSSSEKAKIGLIIKLALVQQESSFFKSENANKSEELEVMKAATERFKNRELQAFRIKEEQKSNQETVNSYVNSMWR